MKVLSLGVQAPEELDNAFAAVLRERPGALLVLADRLFLHNRARIMDFAVQNRLPGVHAYQELVEAGGLMSYGPSYADMHRRAATYVDKILKGAKPADLPVEAPIKFELVINLKAASKSVLRFRSLFCIERTKSLNDFRLRKKNRNQTALDFGPATIGNLKSKI